MKRLGILRGGTGENYAKSLQKGGDLISFIFENLGEKFKVIDVLIDRDGVWHISGVPIKPENLVNKIDLAWNLAHQNISNTLKSFSIPEVGSGAFPSSLESSREMLREHMKKINMQMPRSSLLPVYQRDFDGSEEKYAIKKAKEIHEKFGSPWVVKSFTENSNMGIHVAKTFPELVSAIEDGVKHGKSILVEELIMGKVAPVHSVGGFRGEDIYVFPPGNFSGEEKERLISAARDLYGHIGASHYLKSNFILTPRGKVALLSIECTPDVRNDSHFFNVCANIGVKAPSVIEHILEVATH